MNRNYTFFFLLFLLFLLTFTGSTVFAQDSGPGAAQATPAATPSDNEVNAVAKEMYCPVCENTPLDVCPTTACQEWRDLIRQKLAAGWSEQQIKDYFASQYGDRVLNEPPRRGLNWLVYVLPAIFFLAGVVILANILRKGQKTSPAQASAGQSDKKEISDDPYLAKMEEELRKK